MCATLSNLKPWKVLNLNKDLDGMEPVRTSRGYCHCLPVILTWGLSVLQGCSRYTDDNSRSVKNTCWHKERARKFSDVEIPSMCL